MGFVTGLLGVVRPVLMFGVTIPVWLMLAAGVWLYVDRSSAIREAVNRAVIELVDGAELEAERARNAALRTILEEKERVNARDQETIAMFGQMLADAAIKNEGLADEIAEWKALPLDECVVDDALLERVR